MPESTPRAGRARRALPSSAPEPRFARIAAAIGDPTRARMLAVLLSGELVTAGEIAQAAGVTPQTASAHLALLEREQLVLARNQGRHRYFRLADAEVARALEALSLIAERGPQRRRAGSSPHGDRSSTHAPATAISPARSAWRCSMACSPNAGSNRRPRASP